MTTAGLVAGCDLRRHRDTGEWRHNENYANSRIYF